MNELQENEVRTWHIRRTSLHWTFCPFRQTRPGWCGCTAPHLRGAACRPACAGGRQFCRHRAGRLLLLGKARSLPAADCPVPLRSKRRRHGAADPGVRAGDGAKPARRYDFDLDAPAADEMELHPVCGSFLEEATLPDSVQVIGSCAFTTAAACACSRWAAGDLPWAAMCF